MIKDISPLAMCYNPPTSSRQAARSAHICETRLLGNVHTKHPLFTCLFVRNGSKYILTHFFFSQQVLKKNVCLKKTACISHCLKCVDLHGNSLGGAKAWFVGSRGSNVMDLVLLFFFYLQLLILF